MSVESKLHAHIDAELSLAQLQELASLLADKRRELSDRVEQAEQQMLTKDDCSHTDATDAASAQENRLRARGIVEQHRQTIKEIDAALHRFKTGKYGVSESTSEPVDYARRKLIPWARTGTDDTERDI
jgi:DnaK suppressor protein